MTHIQAHKKQILKSASIISIITVVSRILGYVRDQRLTLLLGTTGIANSFVLAYRIPNVLRRLVGEGSMTAAFIPVFADHMRNRSREETWQFANRLFWTFSTVLAVLTIVGVIFSPLTVRLFSMFGKNQVQIEAVYLNRLMFPYILFIGMAALAMAILNLFSYLRIACGDTDSVERLVHRILDGGCLALLFEPCGGPCGGRPCRGNIAILPSSAATRPAWHEFQIRDIVFRTRVSVAWRA